MILSRRLGFVCYIIPSTVLFFPPLAAYHIPFPVQLYDHAVLVGGQIILAAVMACVAWYAIAIGIVLWPGTPVARPRPWTPGWDSLGHIELLLFLESRLGISFGSEEITHTTRFADLKNLVLAKRGEPPRG